MVDHMTSDHCSVQTPHENSISPSFFVFFFPAENQPIGATGTKREI